MVPFKCKMCGGDVLAVAGQVYGKCDSCGTTTTLPRVTDDAKINLFNRANHFRRKNDFDQAVVVYESILNMDSVDAEAHWGLVLSKYGIEYVEDPVSRRLVPTCHRVQSDPILADLDYLAAIEYAQDERSRAIYETEAKQISEIQKGILAISSREEPYDVFICYKETAEDGSRSRESVLAQEVYYQLTNEGFKVFFSRITLEDKLGQEYEPYIFAALNSSKVMLVIGTKVDHFNAVWVKNEWSRYLALMKKDRNRLLIPCYQEMDAYDIPKELSMLQSQDMSKIGFIQDLLRGIKKVLHQGKPANVAVTAPITANAPTGLSEGEALLDRVFILLEDREWHKADELLEKILNHDPKNARAYLAKLLAKLELPNEKGLPARTAGMGIKSLSESPDFEKALRFADADYRKVLEGYELARKDRKYQQAVSTMNQASGLRADDSIKTYEDAREIFEYLPGYKDSYAKAEQCSSEIKAVKMRKLKRGTIILLGIFSPLLLLLLIIVAKEAGLGEGIGGCFTVIIGLAIFVGLPYWFKMNRIKKHG